MSGYVVINTETGEYAADQRGTWVSRKSSAVPFEDELSAITVADKLSLFLMQECKAETLH